MRSDGDAGAMQNAVDRCGVGADMRDLTVDRNGHVFVETDERRRPRYQGSGDDAVHRNDDDPRWHRTPLFEGSRGREVWRAQRSWVEVRSRDADHELPRSGRTLT